MAVLRVVSNIAAEDLDRANAFYADILGLALAMDHGWIRIYAGLALAPVQISIAREGGSGTPVPALSIEVDDLDAVLARMQAAGLAPVYGPAEEPWGVRRFFVHDPFGTLLNVLQHGDPPEPSRQSN